MDNVKQVIVLRKDLNMRKGKMVSQGSHAALKVFTDQMHPNPDGSFSLTVFGGMPTYTAVAIGPASGEKIDRITGHLKLL